MLIPADGHFRRLAHEDTPFREQFEALPLQYERLANKAEVLRPNPGEQQRFCASCPRKLSIAGRDTPPFCIDFTASDARLLLLLFLDVSPSAPALL